MNRAAKQAIKRYIPRSLLSLKKAIHNKLHPQRPVVETPTLKALRLEHEKLNEGLEADKMAVRKDLVFKLHPETREGFEFFCFRSEEVVQELDSFLAHTQDCRNFLDIGALHGVFSMTFASIDPNRKVVAVDASPIAFSQLTYNIN